MILNNKNTGLYILHKNGNEDYVIKQKTKLQAKSNSRNNHKTNKIWEIKTNWQLKRQMLCNHFNVTKYLVPE